MGIEYLADEVAARLREQKFKCRTVQLSIKSSSLKVIGRQKPLAVPSCLFREISEAAMQLYLASWEEGAPGSRPHCYGTEPRALGKGGGAIGFAGCAEQQARKAGKN